MLGDFWNAPVNANLKSAMCSKQPLGFVRFGRKEWELYKEWTLPVESVPEQIGISTLGNDLEDLGQ